MENLGDDVLDNVEEGEAIVESNVEASAGENDDNNENSTSKPIKPKKIVKNPQPKLNEETLRGPRGLQVLQSHFEHLKLKGKGHEEEDLSVILKTYEHWCHRLFPKLPFDDCIEKIERLGHKKLVKTFINKIRMDLLVEEPLVMDVPDEENNIQVEQFDNRQIIQEELSQMTEEMKERIRQNKERALSLRKEHDNRQISQEGPSQLTEEMKERIRENKEKAAKLRRERLLQRQNIEQLQSLDSFMISQE